jgi:hypothetical protein
MSFVGTIAFSPMAHAQSSQTVTGVGSWTEMTDYAAASGTSGNGGIHILGVSCVVYQNDVYCVGGQTLATFGSNPPGTDLSNVYYAAISSNGALSGWTETTDYGASSGSSGSGGVGIEWTSCVQYNGYIYCVAGTTNGGKIVSDVFYAQLSSSGVGPWTETTDYGAASGTTGSGGVQAFQVSCVADSGYIYCAGGADPTSKVFYAGLSSSGVGPWTETTDYGAASGTSGSGGVAISSTACVDSGGYMYCMGGEVQFTPSSYVFYAPLSSSGVGAWTQTTDYGATSGATGKGGLPIYGTTCVAYSGNIVCVDGDTTGNSGTNAIGFAKDQAISYWDIVDEFPEISYWFSCVDWYGGGLSAYLICYGGGSTQGYTAQLLTGSTTTTTTATTTTTTTTSTTATTTTITTTPTLVATTTTSTGTGIGVGVGIPWTWIGIGIGLLVIIGILVWLFLWRKPPVTPPPGVTDEGTEPGTEEGGLCKMSTEWHLDRFNLWAIPGEEENPSGAPTAVMKHYEVTRPAGEPMPISATSEDMHALVFGCECEEQSEKKLVFMYAVEKFDWEISLGGGGFVKITGGSGKRTENGEQVIYAPPDIPDGKSEDVKILVKAKHSDGTKPPNHGPILLGINLKITHTGKDYVWEWYPASGAQMANEKEAKDFLDPKAAWRFTSQDLNLHANVPCQAYGSYHQTKEIEGVIASTLHDDAVASKALDRQSGECSPGDYVRFEFKGDDFDHFLIQCTPPPTSECKLTQMSIPLLDPLRCDWYSTKGKFVKAVSKYSNVAIWHAPMEEGDVEIQVKVSDSTLEFVDKQYVLGTRVRVRKKPASKP